MDGWPLIGQFRLISGRTLKAVNCLKSFKKLQTLKLERHPAKPGILIPLCLGVGLVRTIDRGVIVQGTVRERNCTPSCLPSSLTSPYVLRVGLFKACSSNSLRI